LVALEAHGERTGLDRMHTDVAGNHATMLGATTAATVIFRDALNGLFRIGLASGLAARCSITPGARPAGGAVGMVVLLIVRRFPSGAVVGVRVLGAMFAGMVISNFPSGQLPTPAGRP